MYIIDDDQHQRLLSLNATVDLMLSNGVDGKDGSTTTISLGYEAFYQRAMYPIAGIEEGPTVHYFPLKQGPGRYYLGRVFLQEAYCNPHTQNLQSRR